MLALPALFKGLLYDSDCMTGVWDLVKRWSFEERLVLTDAAHKFGLEARVGRVQMRELALELERRGYGWIEAEAAPAAG